MAGLLERLSYARSLCITAPLVLVVTIAAGSVSLVSSLFDSSGRLQHACARFWARLVLTICGVRLKFQAIRSYGATFPTSSSRTIKAISTFRSSSRRFQFHFVSRRRRSFSEFHSLAGICAVPGIFQWTDIILMRPSNHSVARAKGSEPGPPSCFFLKEQPAWMAASSASRAADSFLQGNPTRRLFR